jgi:toxin FitB
VIFLDTNVVSETMKRHADSNVIRWLAKNDSQLMLSSVVLAEISAGINSLNPDERSAKLSEAFVYWRSRFDGRIVPLSASAAILAGELLGLSKRRGRVLQIADAMIAAIALSERGQLATRNQSDFENLGLEIINPWIEMD